MRLQSSQSILLIVDIQTRLMPAIDQGDTVLARTMALAQAAPWMGVPVRATEHNASRLGLTPPMLRAHCDAILHKMHFDATREPTFAGWLPPGRPQVILTGCEAHVCVLQTAQGLLAQGYRVALVADAVGSRHAANHAQALARLRDAGADIVTTEMVLFEWADHCEHPHFRDVLELVKRF